MLRSVPIGRAPDSFLQGNGCSAAIGMLIAAVASGGTDVGEAIGFQSADDIAGRSPSRDVQTVTSPAGFPYLPGQVRPRSCGALPRCSSSLLPEFLPRSQRRRIRARERGSSILVLVIFDDDFENVAFQGVLLLSILPSGSGMRQNPHIFGPRR